jgi:hypothetical protein
VDGAFVADVPCRRGVRQGSALSPTLFRLFLRGLVAHVRSLGLGVAELVETGVRGRCRLLWTGLLVYADDIALVARTPEEAQRMVAEVDRWCAAHGMVLSVEKTEVLRMPAYARARAPAGDGLPAAAITVGPRALAETALFKYLGVWLSAQHPAAYLWRAPDHWDKRRLVGRAAYASRFMPLCARHVLRVSFARRLLVGILEAGLLYGCEAVLSPAEDELAPVEGVMSGALRATLGVGPRFPLAVLYGDTGARDPATAIRGRVLRLFGKAWFGLAGAPLRLLVVDEWLRPGAEATTWTDTVRTWLGDCGTVLLRALAPDRPVPWDRPDRRAFGGYLKVLATYLATFERQRHVARAAGRPSLTQYLRAKPAPGLESWVDAGSPRQLFWKLCLRAGAADRTLGLRQAAAWRDRRAPAWLARLIAPADGRPYCGACAKFRYVSATSHRTRLASAERLTLEHVLLRCPAVADARRQWRAWAARKLAGAVRCARAGGFEGAWAEAEAGRSRRLIALLFAGDSPRARVRETDPLPAVGVKLLAALCGRWERACGRRAACVAVRRHRHLEFRLAWAVHRARHLCRRLGRLLRRL